MSADEGAVRARRLEQMTVDECLAALSSAALGRVAFVANGDPHIVPVNYVLDEGMVVFRTTYGITLDSIGGGARVAFEVDRYDDQTHVGWSVVLIGRAEEIWMPEELEAARTLPLRPWAPGDRAHYVHIAPGTITGRRIL